MKSEKLYIIIILVFLLSIFKNLSFAEMKKDLIIFSGAFFSPVFHAIKNESETALSVNLLAEFSGSQAAFRKLTELKRECDIIVSADNTLFKKMAPDYFSWRIDFAGDEMVLGIGIRAKKTDEAERNFIPVLMDKNNVLGRTDENLSPIGYRTLLVWKLLEERGYQGLTGRLKTKSEKVMEDVEHLSALLKSGDVDYGFVYKTTCVEQDIRFISLDKKINLGDEEADYSRAEVSFGAKLKGEEKSISVKGAPIVYSLSIPSNSLNKEKSIEWITFLLKSNNRILSEHGFTVFMPKFYGNKDDFVKFKDYCKYAGGF